MASYTGCFLTGLNSVAEFIPYTKISKRGFTLKMQFPAR